MPVKAVFLDRDNTLIEDPGYLSDPSAVRLLPGAAEAIRRLQGADYRIIVATNQSGIARGLLDEVRLQAIHDRMRQMLAESGAVIDAIYYCPYLNGPEASVKRYRQDSDLRKPKPGMFLLAAREHGIDLAASWSVGDSARDTAAGRAAGCRTIQLGSGPDETDECRPDFRARTLTEAADIILTHSVPGRASTVTTDPNGLSAARCERLLEEIAEHARAWQRRHTMDDFTLMKLSGAAAQLFAVGMAFWAFMAMIDPQPDVYPSHRWLAAIFLQTLALTLFQLHRQR